MCSQAFDTNTKIPNELRDQEAALFGAHLSHMFVFIAYVFASFCENVSANTIRPIIRFFPRFTKKSTNIFDVLEPTKHLQGNKTNLNYTFDEAEFEAVR